MYEGNQDMDGDIIMTADEFFGVPDIGKDNLNTVGMRAKRKDVDKNRFAKIKVKMVMRIYGVSCARAVAIIAGRAEEKARLQREKELAKAAAKKDGKTEADDLLASSGLFAS